MSKILIMTLGSRGDVQPYVALGQGLQKQGHAVAITTASEFSNLVTSAGLEIRPISADFLKLRDDPDFAKTLVGDGNKLKLMKLVMPMLRRTLESEWQVAQDADAILFHPKALGGPHLAEKLGIPAILGFPIPAFTPTAEFANPLLTTRNLGSFGNRLSFGAMNWLSVAPYRGMINRWRKEALQLPPIGANGMLLGRNTAAFYAYSQHVVPAPADWGDAARVTGYWFLDQAPGWQPSPELAQFLAAGDAPIYIGFGSMPSVDAEKKTRIVINAVKQAGVRAILATGWGGLTKEVDDPSLFVLNAAPHDWLFPHCAAVVHHGGAGTTAAGLRAGKPTIICPFFGDQPFWGSRVAVLGVGTKPIPQKQLTADNLAQAIRQATSDPAMRSRAIELGEKIRSEDGVGVAVAAIEEYL